MSTKWASGEMAKSMGGFWAACGGVCWMLGLIFAILGIISEVKGSIIGLTPLSWYLLTIALIAASIAWYIGWAVAVLYKK